MSLQEEPDYSRKLHDLFIEREWKNLLRNERLLDQCIFLSKALLSNHMKIQNANDKIDVLGLHITEKTIAAGFLGDEPITGLDRKLKLTKMEVRLLEDKKRTETLSNESEKIQTYKN